MFLTVDEMVERVGTEEMLQVAGTGSTRHADGRRLDTARVEAAIAFATDFTIARLKSRYRTVKTLQAEQVPSLLKGYVADIARYRLRVRSNNQNQVTDEIRERYKDAEKFLSDLEAGKASIELPGDPRSDETRSFSVLDAHPADRSSEILAGYRP